MATLLLYPSHSSSQPLERLSSPLMFGGLCDLGPARSSKVPPKITSPIGGDPTQEVSVAPTLLGKPSPCVLAQKPSHLLFIWWPVHPARPRPGIAFPQGFSEICPTLMKISSELPLFSPRNACTVALFEMVSVHPALQGWVMWWSPWSSSCIVQAPAPARILGKPVVWRMNEGPRLYI